MRARTRLAVTLLLGLGPVGAARAEAPPAGAASAYAAQRATRWCWAAVLESAFRACGHPVAQERVVRAVYGELVNMRSGPPANIAALLDRAWVDDAGGAFRARLLRLYDASAPGATLDARAVVDALRAGRALVWGTTRHAVLLLDVTYRETDAGVVLTGGAVFDPWPGVGVRALRPEELAPVSARGALALVADFSVTP